MPTSQISVTATPVAFDVAYKGRVVLRNTDASNSVDIINEGEAYGDGFLLGPGESVGVLMQPGEGLMLVCDTSLTATVHVLNVGA